MRGELIYYVLLIISALGIKLALEGFFKTGSFFNRTPIKKGSVLRRLPVIRKLVEKQPYYVRIIPVFITITVFFIALVIYICFWIYPPSVASFLGSPWLIGFSLVYIFALALIIIGS